LRVDEQTHSWTDINLGFAPQERISTPPPPPPPMVVREFQGHWCRGCVNTEDPQGRSCGPDWLPVSVQTTANHPIASVTSSPSMSCSLQSFGIGANSIGRPRPSFRKVCDCVPNLSTCPATFRYPCGALLRSREWIFHHGAKGLPQMKLSRFRGV